MSSHTILRCYFFFIIVDFAVCLSGFFLFTGGKELVDFYNNNAEQTETCLILLSAFKL